MGRPSKAQEAVIAVRRIKLIEMRRKKCTWEQIADALGYGSPSAACQDFKRTLDQRRAELNLTRDELVQEEIEHLEMLVRKAIEVMEREHFKWVGSGDDGSEAPDDGPVLQAIETLRRLSERRAKLLGIDAPTRIEADGELKVIVEGVNTEEMK